MSEVKPAQKRRRFGWRRIHKWIGVAGGTFLLIWIVSGIVIAIPGGGATTLSQRAVDLSYESLTVSPARAIASLSALGVTTESVRGVQLEQLGSRPVYRIQVRGQGVILVDAISGDIVTVDAAEALRLAHELYEGPGVASEPELVTSHDRRYFLGPLPVYRVSFGDPHATEMTVAVGSGAVRWRDRSSRFRSLMAAVHDLWPIRPVLGTNSYVAGMVGGGLLALITALTGYWLAFRQGGWRWKRRTRV